MWKFIGFLAVLTISVLVLIGIANGAEPKVPGKAQVLPGKLESECIDLPTFSARFTLMQNFKLRGESGNLRPLISADTTDGELLIIFTAVDNSSFIIKTKDHGRFVCTLAVTGPLDIDVPALFRNSREIND